MQAGYLSRAVRAGFVSGFPGTSYAGSYFIITHDLGILWYHFIPSQQWFLVFVKRPIQMRPTRAYLQTERPVQHHVLLTALRAALRRPALQQLIGVPHELVCRGCRQDFIRDDPAPLSIG